MSLLPSALASTGKSLFLDSGDLFETGAGHKNCNGCHFIGGGSAGMSFNDATPGFPDIDGSPRGFNIGAGTNVNETPIVANPTFSIVENSANGTAVGTVMAMDPDAGQTLWDFFSQF